MEECYLIVTPSSLGDVIHAFPAVSLLAKHKLQAKIDRVVVSAFADVVRLHPAVNQVSEKAFVLTSQDFPCNKCFRRIYPENNCHRAIPTEQAICSFLAEVAA